MTYHVAELDEDNAVMRVVVVDLGKWEDDLDQMDQIATEMCDRLVGVGRWRVTSYEGAFRRRYASPGMTYDELLDAFVLPQPHPSWVRDLESEEDWSAPVPLPTDETKTYTWNEKLMQWDALDIPERPAVETLGN